MINLNKRALFDGEKDLATILEAIRSPNYYLGSDCNDLNENISSMKYPIHKRLFFSKRSEKDLAYGVIFNVGIDIEEENPYVSKVRLHDKSGEINLFWTDAEKFQNDRQELIRDTGPYLVKKFDYDNLSCTNMVLFDSCDTPQRVRDKQGLKDRDHLHMAVFAYLMKKDVMLVSSIEKSQFTKRRRGKKVKEKSWAYKTNNNAIGTLIPGVA